MAQTLEHNTAVETVTAVALPTFDDDVSNIQKLDDEPNDVGGLTAAQLKKEFDKAGETIADYINETLIPAVLAQDSTEEARQLAESERVANEQERVSNENARVSAEATRATNETARGTAETARATAETARATAEAGRASAETARAGAEALRVSAETEREGAETARASAESGRVTAENARVSAETLRVNAESARVSAEDARASAESGRSTAESGRVSAESTRNANEESRIAAEQARADENNGIVAQATAQAQAAAGSAGAAAGSATAASESAASAAANAALSQSWATGGTGTRMGRRCQYQFRETDPHSLGYVIRRRSKYAIITPEGEFQFETDDMHLTSSIGWGSSDWDAVAIIPASDGNGNGAITLSMPKTTGTTVFGPYVLAPRTDATDTLFGGAAFVPDGDAPLEDVDNARYFSEQARAQAGEASTFASAAQTSASAAAGSATGAATSAASAEDSAEDSEAWAVGQRGGTDVPSTDETYHNNAKYWAGQDASGTAASVVATHAADTDIHVTAAKQTAWTGKADKPKQVYVNLSATWSGTGPYTQTVTVSGATANSKVDLQPTAAQLQQLIDDGVQALYISNNNGVLTAYALGAAPTVALTLQCTMTEVSA